MQGRLPALQGVSRSGGDLRIAVALPDGVREAVLAASHPMPGTVSGGVVRPFRGGWFDAAAIYHD